ncbi:MAG TPA: SDR family NAD(P)-dependent oxidoreductase [Candidatus Hydrogenedentes bacterium]|nr:SDR family NAD(P)-dependent oxidoreductase [Candidatus Hydrogenedentota bacterium]
MGETRHFFLTGCASGIAKHLTGVLLGQGHSVFATDVNLEALENAAREGAWPVERVRLRALDVRDADAWENVFAEAVREFGHIDICMNIAGLLLAAWATDQPINEVHSQIDVNVKGVIFGTRVAARHMVLRGKGHIINIASIAGLTPVPGMAVYAATKYAVRAYSISACMELRKKGVYVTAICPASVQTPMLDGQLHNDAADLFYSGYRMLTVDEIEHAIFKRAMRRRPPYEVHVPRLKTKLAKFVDNFPAVGPIFAPLYQWSGRRRQAQRRAEEQRAK